MAHEPVSKGGVLGELPPRQLRYRDRARSRSTGRRVGRPRSHRALGHVRTSDSGALLETWARWRPRSTARTTADEHVARAGRGTGDFAYDRRRPERFRDNGRLPLSVCGRRPVGPRIDKWRRTALTA